MKIQMTIIALMSSFIFSAQASQTSTQLSLPTTNAKDLDTQVTDIKMRVDSGKKRKLSSSVSMTYKAGTWQSPTSAIRPAIGDQTRPEDQGVIGNFSLRYRENINESFLVAAGFYQQKPFHDLTAAEKMHGETQELEVFSPQVGYNNTFAVKDWELSSNVRAYYNTLDYKKQIGEVWAIGYSLSSLARIKETRARGGVSLNVSYTDFDKDFGSLRGRNTDLRPFQLDYSVNLTPSLQYDFTDKLNGYTSFKVANFIHKRSAEDGLDFEHEAIEQTLGLGYAIVRDVYISPYVIFEPENIQADRTLVNLRASVNL